MSGRTATAHLATVQVLDLPAGRVGAKLVPGSSKTHPPWRTWKRLARRTRPEAFLRGRPTKQRAGTSTGSVRGMIEPFRPLAGFPYWSMFGTDHGSPARAMFPNLRPMRSFLWTLALAGLPCFQPPSPCFNSAPATYPPNPWNGQGGFGRESASVDGRSPAFRLRPHPERT